MKQFKINNKCLIDICLVAKCRENENSFVFDQNLITLKLRVFEFKIGELENNKDLYNFNIPLLKEEVRFIFTKSENMEGEKYINAYINKNDGSIIENELINSFIHLMTHNRYIYLTFTSESDSSKYPPIIEAFSIDLKTSQIKTYSSSNFFLLNLLNDLELISDRKVTSPVSELQIYKF